MGGSDPPEMGDNGKGLAVEKGGSMLFAIKFLYLEVFSAGLGQGDAKRFFVPYPGILQIEGF